MSFDTESKIEAPKVSVITAVYNGEKHIEECILSIKAQTYNGVEHIIIDGGSTDGTLEIINRYRDSISYWISEPDNGIGDAMNKGINAAKGEYIIIIHADDCLNKENSLAMAMVECKDNIDIAMFSILYGKQKKLKTPKRFESIINLKPQGYHQGMICKRQLFIDIGTFDISYKVAMDYEFCLRAKRKKARVMISSVVLSYMGDQGVSAKVDWDSLRARFSEERRIHFQHCNSIMMTVLYVVYWPIYITYRKIRYYLSVIVT